MLEDETFCYEEEKQLTVFKTSHFFVGDGFTVYDSNGEVVFRVDSYGGSDSKDQSQLVLMNASGKCLLTVRKKWPSLHNRWEGFVGERMDGQKPMFSVRRSSIIGRSSVTVEVYGNNGSLQAEEYQIEGSYCQRCCTFYNASREVVAEIKRKVAASTNVVLDKDVFCLCIKPGFDGAFAMALVLVLDQIDGRDDDVVVEGNGGGGGGGDDEDMMGLDSGR
ncbi:hypothetical protein MRB53_011876 [Persea americana]|uniref:Uncharacterized protein n=1 Tax=Persea americana TaxID=3435 RepID=A0ACC2LW81_PERAE|nr:hypothetical protein MRB53_011876 [Persea americana]